MFWKKFFGMFLLAGMVVFSQSVPQASAADYCDWAEYVSDPSVPDGASFTTGAAFTKTWRLMNIGTCTWTTAYKIVFVSGDALGAPASVNLPVQVPPGQMVDISVNMTAPATGGHYKGDWKLSNEAGAAFGIGSSAADSFWVDINVVDINTVIYDFVANAPYAQWKSAAGILPYPGTSGDSRGYSLQVNNPRLEDDSVDTLPGLLTVPHNKYNGTIQAMYPEFLVQQGDRFRTLVNCEFGATGCYVTFRLDYMTSTGSVRTLWTWKESHDGRFYRADIDLSKLAGQRVRFILNLLSTGFASGDRAVWGAPRIIRTGSAQPPAPAPTLTPLPALTPTPTPFATPPPLSPAACERASFVADITVPDGTLFSPGAAFTKTWRLKNTGSCAWTTAYKFLFYSGSQMDAPTALNMPSIISPGQTVDLTLNMAAPQTAGSYRGHWILQNPSGALFGIGKHADMPIWVQVNVAGEAPVNTGYDFVKNACAAEWKVPVGISPCPGLNGDLAGFILPVSAPKLEDGSIGTSGLLAAPQFKYNGTISGTYPAFTVQPGDRFQTTVGCEYGASCYVTFKLDYMTATGSISNFWSWREQNEGRFYNANVDLSPLAGRSVRFILTVFATGSPVGDRVIWGAPQIVRPASAPVITATPTLTPTITPTPTPITTNWLTLLNTTYGFQFMVPPEGQRANGGTDNFTRIDLPFAPGTNLREKYLDVVVAENVTTCRSPLATAMSTSETVTINGLTFLKETGDEGAAGSYYVWIAYSISQGSTCISLDFVLHAINPSNFETPPPVFDKAAESAVLQNIVATFAWLPTSNWLTYVNPNYGFQFNYPPQAQIVDQDFNFLRMNLPYVPGTNLHEKYLEMIATENVAVCRSPLATQSMLTSSKTVTINGISFLKETGEDSGVGHLHQWIAYSTAQGSTCVSLDFILHSVNPGVYETPPPVFDYAAETAVFQNMAATFVWPPATPTPAVPLTPTLNAVVEAVNARNFGAAKAMMDQVFGFAFWGSEGISRTPDEAIEILRNSYIGAATILTSDPNKDLTTLLGGFNPYSIMGLDAAKSQALFVSGWGLDGKGEAILYVTRRSDGSAYWHSVLIAPTGFAANTSLQGPYAVTSVSSNDVLNIRSDAGTANPVVGSFAWDATNVMRTGASKQTDNATWVEIQRPDSGTGWVNFRYLTEYVSHGTFCADARIPQMIEQLKQSMTQSNGDLFASLVGSKHGAAINYWRDVPPVNYTTVTARTIFTDTQSYNWGAGPSAGPPIYGTFAQIVQPDMVAVLNSNYQLGCDDPSRASMYVNPWPHTNIHYYSVLKPPTPDIVFDWKVWLIGFEYMDGQPYLYGTIHYAWEP